MKRKGLFSIILFVISTSVLSCGPRGTTSSSIFSSPISSENSSDTSSIPTSTSSSSSTSLPDSSSTPPSLDSSSSSDESIIPPIKKSVTKVSLTSPKSEVVAEEKIQLSVTVTGENLTDQDKHVTFSIEEGNATVSENGLVSVSSSSQNGEIIRIKAVSVLDPTKSSEVILTVISQTRKVDITFSKELSVSYFYGENGSYDNPVKGGIIEDTSKVKDGSRLYIQLSDNTSSTGIFKFKLLKGTTYNSYVSETIDGVDLFFAPSVNVLTISPVDKDIILDLSQYVEKDNDIKGVYKGFDLNTKKAMGFTIDDTNVTIGDKKISYKKDGTDITVGYRSTTFGGDLIALDLYDDLDGDGSSENHYILASKTLDGFAVNPSDVLSADQTAAAPDAFGYYTTNITGEEKTPFLAFDKNIFFGSSITSVRFEKTGLSDSTYAYVDGKVIEKSGTLSDGTLKWVKGDLAGSDGFKVIKPDTTVIAGTYKVPGKEDLVLDGFANGTSTPGIITIGKEKGTYTYSFGQFSNPYVIDATFGKTVRHFSVDTKALTYEEIFYIDKDVFSTASTFTKGDKTLSLTFQKGTVTIVSTIKDITITSKTAPYTIDKSVISFEAAVEYISPYGTTETDTLNFSLKIDSESPSSLLSTSEVKVEYYDQDDLSITPIAGVLTKDEVLSKT